jgi:hypothetical protein
LIDDYAIAATGLGHERDVHVSEQVLGIFAIDVQSPSYSLVVRGRCRCVRVVFDKFSNLVVVACLGPTSRLAPPIVRPICARPVSAQKRPNKAELLNKNRAPGGELGYRLLRICTFTKTQAPAYDQSE